MILHVETPGLMSTIQDLGRQNFRAYGLPAAGAMDPRFLSTANILVGNPPDAAALELTLLGPSLRVEGSGVLALAGGDLGAYLNGWPLPSTGSFSVRDGDRLQFERPRLGCRSYLAAAGGFDLPIVMGSYSTYVRGAIGGYQGRALQRGDALAVQDGANPPAWLGVVPPRFYKFLLPKRTTVRVIPGPQDDYFDPVNLSLFYNTTWKVSNEADRMGYRLGGATLKHLDKKEIVSDGVLSGAIQVPAQGIPIVLLADAQTSGGYPKIATVISADLGLFGQLQPGDAVRFRQVDLKAAGDAASVEESRQLELTAWLARQNPAVSRYFKVTVGGKQHKVTWQEEKP